MDVRRLRGECPARVDDDPARSGSLSRLLQPSERGALAPGPTRARVHLPKAGQGGLVHLASGNSRPGFSAADPDGCLVERPMTDTDRASTLEIIGPNQDRGGETCANRDAVSSSSATA
jgi:hypothetical protein